MGKSYTEVFRAPIDIKALPDAIQEVIAKKEHFALDGIVHTYDHDPELWDTDRWQIIYKGISIVQVVTVELGILTGKVASEHMMWFGPEVKDIIKGVA